MTWYFLSVTFNIETVVPLSTYITAAINNHTHTSLTPFSFSSSRKKKNQLVMIFRNLKVQSPFVLKTFPWLITYSYKMLTKG